MDIKEISIVVGVTIVFIFCSAILYRIAEGNFLKLLSWSVRILFLLIIFNTIDVSIKIYWSRELLMLKEYTFLFIDTLMLLLLILIKLFFSWKGERAFKEKQKLMTFFALITIALPTLNLVYLLM